MIRRALVLGSVHGALDRVHGGRRDPSPAHARECCQPMREYPKVPELMMRDLVRDDERCAVIVGAAFEQSAREVDVSPGRGERGDHVHPGNDDDESLALGHDALQAQGDALDTLGGPAGLLDHAFVDDCIVQPGAEGEAGLDVEVIALQGASLSEIVCGCSRGPGRETRLFPAKDALPNFCVIARATENDRGLARHHHLATCALVATE
jgi:hypothetical protein